MQFLLHTGYLLDGPVYCIRVSREEKGLESSSSTIDAPILLAAAASAILISLLTVSYQGLKAAIVNPIESLRSE